MGTYHSTDCWTLRNCADPPTRCRADRVPGILPYPCVRRPAVEDAQGIGVLRAAPEPRGVTQRVAAAWFVRCFIIGVGVQGPRTARLSMRTRPPVRKSAWHVRPQIL